MTLCSRDAGDGSFVHASRALARALLFNHLNKYAEQMHLAVHAFEDLEDEAWATYRRRVRVC